MSNPTTSTRKWNATILVGLFVFTALFVTIIVLVSPRNITSGPVGSPIAGAQNYVVPGAGLELPLAHLEGDWQMKEDGIAFVAKVAGNHIEVTMASSDDTSMVIWDGSFVTAEAPGHQITSNATGSFQLSQDATKVFTVNVNEIAFDFKMMGVKRTVVLARG